MMTIDSWIFLSGLLDDFVSQLASLFIELFLAILFMILFEAGNPNKEDRPKNNKRRDERNDHDVAFQVWMFHGLTFGR